MHVHILGICGTFMGSLALLARDLGHTVTGSDSGIYPPMSTQLQQAGVSIEEGYLPEHLQPAPDLVIVGNAMSRGNAAVEYLLNENLAYTSGPQFLAEQVLQHRHVIAVAGTHGKTTTTTMLAWILHYCGIDTGFLIGGVPLVNSMPLVNDVPSVNSDRDRLTKIFAHSSYLGANTTSDGKRGYFVIEADEYDSAFFDKRSKFVHYRPRTAILNNLEFDHADIFADLTAIQTQFHHMIRMIPSNGQIIMPAQTPSLEATLAMGCWCPVWRTQLHSSESLNSEALNSKSLTNEPASAWQAELLKPDGSQFSVSFTSGDAATQTAAQTATVSWAMTGRHNVANALVAVAAAVNVGVSVVDACTALSSFAGIKRRMELLAELTLATQQQVAIYDDFAHHPTAIATTLDGAKKSLTGRKLWAIIEPRSNTMKLGVHKDSLAHSAALADAVLWYEPAGLEWGLKHTILTAEAPNQQQVMNSTQAIIDYVVAQIAADGSDAAIVIMSNGGFEGIHQRLLQALQAHSA